MTITIRDWEGAEHPLTPGCYIDGRWGQYGPDRLAAILADFQPIDPDDDPRVWRQRAEMAESMADPADRWPAESMADPADRWPGAVEWEAHHETAEYVLDTLNDITTGGYWEWYDGDLFLNDADDDDYY